MSTPEERWWSVRAGEYVLGTLRGQDLELFKRILSHDTAMQAEVARWERRLSGLQETTRAVQPGDHVWPGVLGRIRAQKGVPLEAERSTTTGLSGTGTGTGTETEPPSPSADVSALRRGRSTLWPLVAGLATAASLMLGFLLYERTVVSGPLPLRVDGLAVVLSDEDGEPYFLVETDYENQRVRVTALTPPALSGDRNFQLWQALPDRSSVRAVALLPRDSGRSRVFDVDSLIEGSDLFGVSLEPEDASTDAGPTGPVVAHGDFLLTENAD